MTATLIKAQCALPYDTGFAEDVAVNTFHFRTAADWKDEATSTPARREAIMADISARLFAAYQLVDAFLSEELTGALEIRQYDLEAPPPRVPRESFHTLTVSTGTTALPSETALCLSFEAVRVAGERQARRRGRTYFGPFTSSLGTIDSSPARPASALRTAIRDFGASLLAANDADATWVIFSPTNYKEVFPGIPGGDGGPLDDSASVFAAHDVASGWVDNAWDHQLRRGHSATTRLTF